MEDPFSVLSVFVPDPPSRPHLTPVHPADASPLTILAPTTLLQDTRPAPTLSTTDTKLARKRYHWTLTRTASARTKIKDRDDDDPSNSSLPSREAHTIDWGALAPLSATLQREMAMRGQTGRRDVAADESEEEEMVREIILDNLQGETTSTDDGDITNLAGYWTLARAKEAEKYVQDVVYGGASGFAYVRSLAEFVDESGRDGCMVCVSN